MFRTQKEEPVSFLPKLYVIKDSESVRCFARFASTYRIELLDKQQSQIKCMIHSAGSVEGD